MTTVIRAGSPAARTAQAAGTYVYIGRPSQWGNPFHISPTKTRTQVIALFETYWYAPDQAPLRNAAVTELQDKVCGCYCHPKPCHGDVIAAYVNEYHARHPPAPPIK
jgi:hypothetical protein